MKDTDLEYLEVSTIVTILNVVLTFETSKYLGPP